jgi:DNA polymerase-3 subunit gamma/tau
MTYLALARKWRPKRFDQLVGQPHVVQSLVSALTQNKVHHAYLFTGTHGIGKTTIARIFAKCLNCETGVTATPCDQCMHCQEIDAGRFPDLYEIDAASRTKVEDTRDLLDSIPYAPTKGRFKVYLIDEVHMLSGHSFNALLKTLEEPPEHVKFLLATTDPQKLPITVLSRCLQFHLAKMLPEQIENQLSFILQSEKIHFEPDALQYISQSANGSMRDSLSLLDQCIAYGNGQVKAVETQMLLGLSSKTDMTTLLTAIHNNDAEAALSLTKSWASQGVNFSRGLSDFLTHLYHMSVKQSIDKSDHGFSREEIQLYYQIALIGQRDLPLAPTPQIGFEMVVMRMMAFVPDQASNQPMPSEVKTNNSQKDQNVQNIQMVKKIPSRDWNTLLNDLKLTGPTLALAQHCAMCELTENTLSLVLQPKYAALLNSRQQQRIEEALTQLSDVQFKVKITVEENNRETPVDSLARLHDMNKQSAKNAISADTNIQRIVKTFDATVIEDSIEPPKQ